MQHRLPRRRADDVQFSAGRPAARVALRPLRNSHAPAMLRWMQDPAIARNIGLRRHPTLALTLAWIKHSRGDKTCQPRAIYVGSRHVGNVVLDRIDKHLGSARLSIYVGEADVRGRGVGATAIGLLINSAFRRYALNKIWLTVHVQNTAAIRTYLRLGFVQEGRLREEFLLDGKRVDMLLLSFLRREYDASDSRPTASVS